MRFLVLVSVLVVVGSTSGQGFLRDTPEVEAARNAFVREFNRIALLTAQAPPDTDNFNEEPRRLLRADTSRQQQVEPRRQPQAFANLPNYTPIADTFSYSVNLGSNQQFHPGPRTFPAVPTFSAAPTFPAIPTSPAAPTFPALPTSPAAPTFSAAPTFHPESAFPVPARIPAPRTAAHRFAPAPVARWMGPQADTIPAGVGGDVTDTKDVAAAKAAHLQAVAAALGYQGNNFAA